ncbi:FAD dependent oxidoreductase [Coniochaeta ligniaria NRRL 30616]|uniref:FAD dependent oxidoreductase n=1 Tax=Coniochaeta ligniaria NRRL 30616 TaxID=1408157 RepID=A0A1J7IV21_9PEZI|nr:FAD dependent oxidoreductase [Coniochaeta ligniaria NRRL 30616]
MSTTVIIGAGIIGVSTAYYLSDHQPGSTIHLVEASPELFSSASGYAGGFLAKDWFSPATASLGALSFEQHRILAEKNGGREKWGYSPTTTVSYTSKPAGQGPRKRGDDWLRHGTSRADVAPAAAVDDLDGRAPKWLRRVEGDEIEIIGDHDSTAQVDPLALCRFLLAECLDRGVQLHQPATAISMTKDIRDELSSVCIADTGSSTEVDVPCTRVVIAAGAWSGEVFRTLFRHSRLDIPVGSLAGHSLVVRSPRWHKELEGAGCHALYTTSGPGYSPEIFSRIGGQIYISGLNSSTLPLPKVAGESKPRESDIARLKETASELLGPEVGVDDLEVVREELCFRPVTPSGRPIISRVRDVDLGIGIKTRPGAEGGVFIAAGHGPWGISLSLGTGMVLAEMVQGRAVSADVSRLGLP